MNLRTILAATVAVSLATAPAIAQAAGQPLPARDGSQLSDAENMRGGFLIPAIAIIAIILGILALTSDGGDRPRSP